MQFTQQELICERDRRRDLFEKLMSDNNLDGLFFTSTAQQTAQLAVKYASGYTLSSRRDIAYMAPGADPYLVVPTVGQQFHARRISWLPEDHILCGDLIESAKNFICSLNKERPRIGLYESEELPVKIDRVLRSLNAEYVDITAEFTAARQNKSEFELKCIKDASRIAMDSFREVIKILEPGKAEREMVGCAEGYIRAHGGEDTLILIRAQKPHTFISRAGNDPVAEDAVYVYSVEMAGPYGYWTQCVRPVFMKKDTQNEAYRILEAIKEAEAAGAAKFKVGNRVCDVAEAIEDVIAKYGLKMGVWSGHGMGADLGDCVDIGRSNKMEIVPNMILTLHPSVMSDEDGLLYGNTWMSTEGDPICLTPEYSDVHYLEDLKKLV